MILADAAESSIAGTLSQGFFYLAIVIAVGYFGWQFYKGTKDGGNKPDAGDRSEGAGTQGDAPSAIESTGVDTTADGGDDADGQEPDKPRQ